MSYLITIEYLVPDGRVAHRKCLHELLAEGHTDTTEIPFIFVNPELFMRGADKDVVLLDGVMPAVNIYIDLSRYAKKDKRMIRLYFIDILERCHLAVIRNVLIGKISLHCILNKFDAKIVFLFEKK